MKVKNRKTIFSVQRRAAIRVAFAHRTVSGPAIMVVAGVIPQDLLTVDRQTIFCFTPAIDREEDNAAAGMETLQAWQDRWDSDVMGRWTYRLIRDVNSWLARGHGRLNSTCVSS